MAKNDLEINQYKSIAEHIDLVGMDAYIKHGDWMLLVSTKEIISEIDFEKNYVDKAYRKELQKVVQIADAIIKKNITKKQLNILIELNPDLPIHDWWK